MAPSRYASKDADASKLGEPLHFNFSGRTAPNRFLKAAMSEQLSSWSLTDVYDRGIPSKNLINVYKRWGEGGFGIILTGNTMIEYDHLEGAGNAIVPRYAPFEGERFEAFREMATQGKKHGALMIAQVSHPGRQVIEKIQPHPISASDVQLKENIMGATFAKPRPANDQDIANVIEGFAHAAEYLENAGFDGIELHGAHGYLLAQFLSLTTNKRTDKYGGSLENRARLIIEIAEEIRKRVTPSFVIGIKLNSVEFQDQGFQPEEAQKLCALLESHKFDFVELSGGTYEIFAFEHKRESTRKREAFFIEFAEMIAPVLKDTRAYVTGGLKTAGAMVAALDACDGVGLGVTAAQEFRLPAAILEGKVQGAIQPKIDPNNFVLGLVIAGTQMRQVGKDEEPMDMSHEENVAAFIQDMGQWSEKMKKEGEYGYVDLTTPAIPYGTSLA